MYKNYTKELGMPRKHIYKLLLIMRLTAVILIATFMQVSATGLAQTLSFKKNKTTYKEVFTEIKSQLGYNVVWLANKFDEKKTVDVNFSNASLESVLNKTLEGLPVSYTVKNKTVVLKVNEEVSSFRKRLASLFADIDVHLRVVDSKRNPLAGASVSWKSAKGGFTTNADGEFTFRGMDENAVLTISYVGYITQSLKAKPDMGTIVLQLEDSKLDEVQVIGYGTNTRRFSTGSATTVTAEDIAKQPVTNLLLALQGRVPGLVVTAGAGVPGASARIQIRGQNSLKTSSSNGDATPYDQPLFIIDGVPYAPQNNNSNLYNALGQSMNSNTQLGFSPFNSINPADIESITVLRDADATSIYGTQGSNGVILITTKKGKAGKISLSANVNRSVNNVTKPLQMLNTQQYLDLRHEAAAADGLTTEMMDNYTFPDLLVFDQNKNTDFYKDFFGGTASITDAHATLSGGSNATTFVVSGGYTDSRYNFPGDYADKRYTLHSNIHHSGLNERLTVDFGTDYSYDRNNTSGNPNLANAYLTPPNMPDLLDGKGNLVWNYQGLDISSYQQYAYLRQTSLLESYNLNNSLRAKYKIIDGLFLSANMGYSRFSTIQYQAVPKSTQNPLYNSPSTTTFGNTALQTINIEPQIDYVRKIGKGTLSALLGGSYKKNMKNISSIFAYGYANESMLGSVNGATNVSATDDNAIYKYAAVFGRLNYQYDGKYIINVTGRRDGSSNFGPNRQFGNYGSAGLGWIFSEEEGFKEALPFLSYAKLTGSYGTTGSDGIDGYKYLSYWKSITDVNTFQGIRPLQVLNAYNPDYSWSLKKTLNLGVDLGFFDNRVLLNATWYQSRTGNQLINYTLPTQTGFNSVLANFDATVQNSGLEFSVSSTNIKSRGFTWTTAFNISTNRNKLIAFDGIETSPYANIYKIGEPTTTVFGYQYKGVNPTTGVFEFYKANGETTYDPVYGVAAQGGDMVPIADTQPKFFGGLGNTFTYRGISLTAFFEFKKQTGLNYLYSIYSQSPPGSYINLPVQALDHWKNLGDASDMMRLTTGYDYYGAASSFVNSSGAFSDASYIRLKTLSLDYTLPDHYLSKANLRNVRVFMNAQNLLTITGYKVGDPEMAGNLYSFPLQRTLSFGLSFNL